jgi:predicted ATPase with chaperone activity
MNEDDQILAQLKEDLRNFTDRDEAAGMIRKQVDAGTKSAMPMLMFYGVGGAGKSMLAARLRQIFQRVN